MLVVLQNVFFHIGTHKTGSTAIQHWLDENSVLLNEFGVDYPEEYRDVKNPNRRHDHRLLPAFLRGQTEEFPENLDLSNLKKSGPGIHTAIYSSENFWHVSSAGQLAMLRAAIGVAKPHVVAVIRNPADHLVSLWKEMLKSGLDLSLIEFVRGFCELRFDAGSFYGYESRLDLWGAYFGNASTIDYSRLQRDGVALLSAFLDSVSLGHLRGRGNQSRSYANKSMSDIQALCLLYANQLTANPESRVLNIVTGKQIGRAHV